MSRRRESHQDADSTLEGTSDDRFSPLSEVLERWSSHSDSSLDDSERRRRRHWRKLRLVRLLSRQLASEVDYRGFKLFNEIDDYQDPSRRIA